MNIREDRSYITTEKHWFDRGYAKEDLYSLRLSFLYSEAERAANLQYSKEHSQEEFDRHFIRSNQMRSDEMAIIMETISRHFICLQYNEEDDIAYHSEQWDLFFWCNYFNSSLHTAGLSGRDYSYFTLSFNKAHTLEMRKEICEQVLHLLSSHFQSVRLIERQRKIGIITPGQSGCM